MSNKLYTVQVKFDKTATNVYDYATDLPCVKIGDTAIVIGAFGEVKQVTVVNAIPLTNKTTKAIAGIIQPSKMLEINKQLDERTKINYQIKAQLKKLENTLLEQFAASRDPEFAKLIAKRDSLGQD